MIKKIISPLMAVVIIILFATCEKQTTPGVQEAITEYSNFYVLNVKKGFPRTGFTLLNVDSYQQTTEYSCGPASILTLLRYHGKSGDEMTIAKEMGTSTTYGTTPEQMSSWLNEHGFQASWQENGNLDTLTGNLKKQIPTLVEWSDWGGHWVLVVGYDTRNTASTSDDVIIFADPYDRHDDNIDGLTWFNAERFYYMWYDALLFGKVMKRIYISVAPDSR
jgi:hypothetical protein